MAFDPLKPTGYDDEAIFDQRVHAKVFGPEGKLRTSSTVSVDYRHDGIYLNVKRTPNAPPTASSVSSTSIGKLTAVYDNYIVVTDLVSGAVIRAAKMYSLRNNIPFQKTLDGTVWALTYTGASLSYQARGKIPSPNPNGVPIEYQRVTPVYCPASGTVPADQIVYAQMSASYAASVNIKTIAADNTIATGTLVTYLEIGPPRLWAKKLDQTTP